MGSWLGFPFIEDSDVLDPRYDPTFSYLYDDFELHDSVKDFLSGDTNPWADRENSDHNAANNYYLTLLGSIPGLDSALKGMGAWKDLSDYMKNNNLSWADVIPWHANRSFSLGAGAGTLNWMSSNVERLYRM